MIEYHLVNDNMKRCKFQWGEPILHTCSLQKEHTGAHICGCIEVYNHKTGEFEQREDYSDAIKSVSP